jgi:hypothetical protein
VDPAQTRHLLLLLLRLLLLLLRLLLWGMCPGGCHMRRQQGPWAEPG